MQIKIRHVVLVVALLLLTAVVTTPWVIGRNVRALAVTNPLELLPPEIQSQVTVLESRVDSGWLRSNIELAFRFQPLGEQAIEFRTTMDVQHGPLLRTPNGLVAGLIYADIDPQLDSNDLRELRASLPFELPAMHVNLLVDLRNTLLLNMTIDPITHAGADGQLDFAGLNAQLVTFADLSAEFSLQMPKLAAQEAGTALEFSIQGVELATHTAKVYDLLATSSTLFTIDTISAPAPNPVMASEFAVETRLAPSPADDTLTNIFQRLSVASLESDLPVSALSWSWEFNEVSSDSLRRYYELAVQIQTEMDNNGGNVTQQASRAGEELGLLLLQNRLIFNNTITTTAYGGDHSADLRILWRGLPDMRNIFALDLNAAMAALEVTLDLSLDLDAVTRSPAADLIDPYIQAGLIELAGGRIVARASFVDNELTVNGVSMPLDTLFQLPTPGN